MTINLINVYASNHDDPDFFKDFDYVILCGDLNLVLSPKKDSYNYNNVNNPKVRIATVDLISELDLLDIYRTLHTDTKCYTSQRKKSTETSQTRFFFYIGKQD